MYTIYVNLYLHVHHNLSQSQEHLFFIQYSLCLLLYIFCIFHILSDDTLWCNPGDWLWNHECLHYDELFCVVIMVYIGSLYTNYNQNGCFDVKLSQFYGFATHSLSLFLWQFMLIHLQLLFEAQALIGN